VLLLALANERDILGKLLSTRIVCLLGEASYAFYILHVSAFIFIHKQMELHLHTGVAVEGMIYLTVTVAASIAIWKWYETPMRQFIRTRLSR
jgi:peptidoglycan/LPS O-acetylase OafA/YrhL